MTLIPFALKLTMDLVYIGLMLVAAGLIFLILITGRRKHEIVEAMRRLQTRRLELKKKMEHIKMLQQSGEINQREAFTNLAHYETELADVERKLAELKERPLGRTLKKHQKEMNANTKQDVEEFEEARDSEKLLVSKLDAKTFVIIIGVVAIAMAYILITLNPGAMSIFDEDANENLAVKATAIPEKGTFPGGVGGVRVEVENTGGRGIDNLVLGCFSPEGSGILFDGRPYYYERIDELEAGGLRDFFVSLNVSDKAIDGEYMIHVELSDAKKSINKTSTAKLIVAFGSELEEL